jgi:hypothetical protein
MGFLVACAVGVAIGLLLLWSSARAAITIAVLEIRNGEVRVAQGGLAPRVLDDVRDVAVRPRIKSATVRVTRARGHAKVDVRGAVTAAQVQRLRNVIGNVAVAQLANARRR